MVIQAFMYAQTKKKGGGKGGGFMYVYKVHAWFQKATHILGVPKERFCNFINTQNPNLVSNGSKLMHVSK